ncbi:MAG TPA: ribosome biogenesis GTP-binding protein YihA/YsxC [Kofleriaceae bacterium]|nr:ribosome biogenesis GTP-binding protein YihA/YsxC [Kofleriaceae bacterium]
MRAREARFLISASQPDGFPPPGVPEVAFAGRSNVGKSSLINALTGHLSLARTSNTPGRTRLVNWFEVLPPKGKPIAFVDLPGYGYAKVSKAMRAEWRPLIEAYLADRSVLRAVVVLVDARRGAELEERELIEWLLSHEIRVIPVLTKVDKLSKSKRKPAGAALVRELSLSGQPVLFSAQSGEGQDELWRAILDAVKKHG